LDFIDFSLYLSVNASRWNGPYLSRAKLVKPDFNFAVPSLFNVRICESADAGHQSFGKFNPLLQRKPAGQFIGSFFQYSCHILKMPETAAIGKFFTD
jgi:hypothetical protein